MRLAARSRTDQLVGVVLVTTFVVLLLGLWREAGADRPMSIVDEHVHLDTHAAVHRRTYPHRGSLMGPEVVDEWACGVGHEGGSTAVPCGDPTLGPGSLPSGQYTSGYIHYPTYFVAAEVFREGVGAVGLRPGWVTAYRHFATVMTLLGVVACFAVARSLGLWGSALVAATFAPVASASILLYGVIANPTSSAVLTGALIAGAGLRWALAGRGFWWLVAATALAAATAVTQSLPAGVFMVAAVLVIVLRRRGWTVDGPWVPRWWHVGVLAVVVVAPVLVYGHHIESSASRSDHDLYAFASYDGPEDVVAGGVWELSILHSPWHENVSLVSDGNLLQVLARSAVQGLPAWTTLLVIGLLVLVAVAGLRSGPRAVTVPGLLAIGAFVVLQLYPPALRLSNALNAGIDYPVVARYSIGLAPVLVLLAVLVRPGGRWPVRVLALLATASVVGIGVGLV